MSWCLGILATVRPAWAALVLRDPPWTSGSELAVATFGVTMGLFVEALEARACAHLRRAGADVLSMDISRQSRGAAHDRGQAGKESRRFERAALPGEREPDPALGSARKGHAMRVLAHEPVVDVVPGHSRCWGSHAPEQVATHAMPAAIGGGLALAAAWALAGPDLRWPDALNAGIAVLMVAGSRAGAIAVPIVMAAAAARAANNGLVFRGARALETLAGADTIVIAGMATLTQGRPRLTSVMPALGRDEDWLLQVAASLALHDDRRWATAIVAAAAERGLAPLEAVEPLSRPGTGITGRVAGRAVALGGKALMIDERIETWPISAVADESRASGRSVAFLAMDGRVAGLLAQEDSMDESAPALIAGLRAEGVKVVLMTTDSAATARALALRMGIDEVAADLLPADKAREIERLRARGRRVAVVGEARWDAAALVTADVSITAEWMLAESAGHVDGALARPRLADVVRARSLSLLAVRRLRQNRAVALTCLVIGIPLAAGLLVPLLGVSIGPELAALLGGMSSIVVIANALRLTDPET